LSASRWWCRRAPVRHAESNFISVTHVTVVTVVPLFQLWKKKREEPPNKKAATKTTVTTVTIVIAIAVAVAMCDMPRTDHGP